MVFSGSCEQNQFSSSLREGEAWDSPGDSAIGNAEASAAAAVRPSQTVSPLREPASSLSFRKLGAKPRAPENLPNDHPLGGRPKRILDVTIATTALVLLLPLIAIISLLILVTLKRPILFSHMRIGQGGRPFVCYKFRTMVVNSEDVLRRHIETNQAAAEEWAKTRKLATDPRVTFLGRMLRISSLDELPQLINIIRGDMSCVGPRPVVADELARYGDSAKAYIKARPGLTGSWQVSGRNALKYEDRVALDRAYVENWSFSKDIDIILRTVPAILRFKETS